MPHYGYSEPNCNYFQSNLIYQNFVISDITNRANHALLYDERHQGKGCDAVCSLRMRHHLKTKDQMIAKGVTPQLCLTLLDNCCGQNKSNAVMQFFCMLSVIFYPVVAVVYLIPGHSHMICDRVVAWAKASIKGKNIFSPYDLAKTISSVKSINSK